MGLCLFSPVRPRFKDNFHKGGLLIVMCLGKFEWPKMFLTGLPKLYQLQKAVFCGWMLIVIELRV